MRREESRGNARKGGDPGVAKAMYAHTLRGKFASALLTVVFVKSLTRGEKPQKHGKLKTWRGPTKCQRALLCSSCACPCGCRSRVFLATMGGAQPHVQAKKWQGDTIALEILNASPYVVRFIPRIRRRRNRNDGVTEEMNLPNLGFVSCPTPRDD